MTASFYCNIASSEIRALAAFAALLCFLGAAPSGLTAAPGVGSPLSVIRGEVHRVKNVVELKTALDAINRSKAPGTLLLEDGTYVLDTPGLEITSAGTVVRGASGNRDAVIVRGPDEGPKAAVGNVFLVSGNNVVIADLTLGYCRYHGVQVRGEPPYDVAGLLVHNCRLVNCNEQFIKGSSSDGDPVGATDGCIEQCLFEFTSGWAYQYYTGGIDIHKGVNWRVRDNLFRNIRVPEGQQNIAEHAVHFWKRCSTRAQNIIVERNWIVNCDRGIGFGLGSLEGGLQGGASIIRNNMVFNDGAGPHTDVGIGLEHASGVHVDNNTVVIQKYWAPMEYRFAGSSNLVFRNNLVNGRLQLRDAAPVAAQQGNLEYIEPAWFRNLAGGDLRLTPAAKPAIDAGVFLDDFKDDVDQGRRPQGSRWDIGASEFIPGFSVQTRNEPRATMSWLFRPDGAPFFSSGVCVVDQGATAQTFNPTNPGYASFQHYTDSNHWARATMGRLKSWGFTTVGGWSDYRALQNGNQDDVAFTPVLHLGSSCGAPWLDMWDTNRVAKMHRVAREQILPLKDDPRLLGYYSDNEIGWWNAAMFNLALEAPAGSGARSRLIQLLRTLYNNSWANLLRDFETENVQNFEELEQRGKLYLRPGSRGIRAYRQFLGLIADRYYALMKEVIRTYDQRALILGDRYQSFVYPEVAHECGKQVDAISGNFNTAWNDGAFQRYYLECLHNCSDRPVLVSEFYMAARENRSGNRNDTSHFPTVITQKERTAGFRATIEALAKIPYVIGADWFQYYDEPTHGRGDGENYNFGLVDIHNRPYEELVNTAAKLKLTELHLRTQDERPNALWLGVPPAPRDPLGQFTAHEALASWDRRRGFVSPTTSYPVADLYLCWNKDAVFVGLYAQDIVELDYYRTKTLPEVDRALWSVEIGDGGRTISARLGPFAPASCSNPAVRLVNLSGLHMNTRNIAAMEIPAALLGKDRLKRGDRIKLASMLFTHARAERVNWGGTFTLK